MKPRSILVPVAVVATAVAGGFAFDAVRADVGSRGAVPPPPFGSSVHADVVVTPRSVATDCDARFEPHTLPHVTRAADEPARLFDSNGSGVAADDLDGDGLPDIVLGNLEGPNTILWNEGAFRFTRQEMRDRSTRTVQLVDVDADGRLDIVTTHRGAGLAVFRNLGSRQFEQVPVRGVGAPAYSMSWADIDGDGDLDLATSSYDAELDQVLRSSFLFGDGAGVFLYRNLGDRFEAERLATDAQGLVTALVDLDADGHADLFVGNDFGVPDATWRNDGQGTMLPFDPFSQSAAHPMSFDLGDVDGDGTQEIFVTDMVPATVDVAALAEWMPLMATMNSLDDPRNPQKIRNMLHAAQPDGSYRDDGERAGVDAAGWAWSGRFGDLDNDGDVDLHVVNGMIAAETFHYLPGAEIVEPNITFSNRGDGSFTSEQWGLESLGSGRGSVLADLDLDGRLDLVVNNLQSPAMAYRNRRCEGGSITVSLRQPGTGNTHAIGATVWAVDDDHRWVRSVRSGGGYLSGSPSVLHIGTGDTQRLDRLDVRWPDGSTTSIPTPAPGHHYEVIRS